MLNRHDAYIKRKREDMGVTSREYKVLNIRDVWNSKMINVEKCYREEENEKLRELLISYQDVFSWYYDDLKGFMGARFKHDILLKPKDTPFCQK